MLPPRALLLLLALGGAAARAERRLASAGRGLGAAPAGRRLRQAAPWAERQIFCARRDYDYNGSDETENACTLFEMCDGDLGECRSWDCDECDMEYDESCDFSCNNNAFCVQGVCQDPDDPEMCEAWSWSPSMCAGDKVCGDDGFCAAAEGAPADYDYEGEEAPPVMPAAVPTQTPTPTPTPTPAAPLAVSPKPAVAALAPAAAKPASAGFASAPLGALVAAVAALAM